MTAHYCKIADSVVDASLSPYAGWLYTVIVRHINRKCNELRKTVKELAALASMSTRSVLRYTKILESKGLLNVVRNQDGDVADINVYQLSGESAQISLFNGVPSSHKPSDSQSQAPAEGHVPQSHRNESDSNDSLNVRERDYQPEGIDQSKFLFDDPGTNAEDIPQYLRRQVPSETIRQQLAAYSTKLGLTLYAEVMNRCANARSWEYVLKALANEPMPSPGFAAPPSHADDTTEQEWSQTDELSEEAKAVQEQPEVPSTVAPEAAEHWDVAYSQLKIQLDRNSFEAWLRGTKLVAVEGNQWRFSCKAQYAADMLQHRLYREIRRVLSDVIGCQRDDIDLHFAVAGAVHSG